MLTRSGKEARQRRLRPRGMSTPNGTHRSMLSAVVHETGSPCVVSVILAIAKSLSLETSHRGWQPSPLLATAAKATNGNPLPFVVGCASPPAPTSKTRSYQGPSDCQVPAAPICAYSPQVGDGQRPELDLNVRKPHQCCALLHTAAQMRKHRGADRISTPTCTLFFEEPTDRAGVCTNNAGFPEEAARNSVPHAHCGPGRHCRAGKEDSG